MGKAFLQSIWNLAPGSVKSKSLNDYIWCPSHLYRAELTLDDLTSGNETIQAVDIRAMIEPAEYLYGAKFTRGRMPWSGYGFELMADNVRYKK